MEHLYVKIAALVEDWRKAGYPCADYPAIAEILHWAEDSNTGTLRFLRRPQLHALEAYWYLRLVEKTPHVFELYNRHYASPRQMREALGLRAEQIRDYVEDNGMEALWERIKTDDQFVSDFKLEALRETLTLDYPSYILALAMGAGKTILIGAIIATEFALSLEYPQAEFVQNALVFAPGTTIVRALREIQDIPYAKLLPPRLHKEFAASVKLTFTREGEKDIPVIRGSRYNLVVTNTEKIRIQKRTVRKGKLAQTKMAEMEEQEEQIANLRLQAIASLPNLAIFSDEAHHTYGQDLGKDLKRVRQTVDYLHHNTNLICVVNTTGTPYYEKQLLKDIVIWYGLSQGIGDGILKSVADNIKGYGFQEQDAGAFIAEVVTDFFKDYADVRLPNGAWAKLAIYFPQNDDLMELRPFVEQALSKVGQSSSIILRNTSESSAEEIREFDHLNDPDSLKRIILLVNKGAEGWNCPSLFACALARKLKTSANFVLQAGTRCLRQVPGNTRPARIYLSRDNRSLLDTQLQETYGETLSDLDGKYTERFPVTLRLRKLNLQPITVTQTRRIVVPVDNATQSAFALVKPNVSEVSELTRAVYTPSIQANIKKVLNQVGETETLKFVGITVDPYTAANDLAAVYRVSFWPLYQELCRCYGSNEVPVTHMDDLAQQIETQTRAYEVQEKQVEVALALVKPQGFTKQTGEDGSEAYVTEIVLSKDKYALLCSPNEYPDNSHGFGFHYAPYNFDSGTEKFFLSKMLDFLNQNPDDVEDIYFTGAFTDSSKTDFCVEYQDAQGKWHTYTPDFLIRRKDGKCLIVEIKMGSKRNDPVEGIDGKKSCAVRRWQAASHDRIKYEIYFDTQGDVAYDDWKSARQFVKGISA